MALQGIVNAEAPAPQKTALQNAYKAFDLAKTLASLYGSANTVFGTKAPNYPAIQQQAPTLGFGSSGNQLASYYNSLGK